MLRTSNGMAFAWLLSLFVSLYYFTSAASADLSNHSRTAGEESVCQHRRRCAAPRSRWGAGYPNVADAVDEFYDETTTIDGNGTLYSVPCVHVDGQDWSLFLHCNNRAVGNARSNDARAALRQEWFPLPAATVVRMAKRSSQIMIADPRSDRIQQWHAVSVPDEYPIENLQNGVDIAQPEGKAASYALTSAVWHGPEQLVASLASYADSPWDPPQKGFVEEAFHPYNNNDGLHVVTSGSELTYCTWSFEHRNDSDQEIAMYVNYVPNTVDSDCRYRTENGSD